MNSSLKFPLAKRIRGLSSDPESFLTLDLLSEVDIPVTGHPGAFAHERRHHCHEGVDLYGLEGDQVYSMEAGTVVGIIPFTGPRAGFPWWLDTQAVLVEGAHGVFIYGELLPHHGLKVGHSIAAGEGIGQLTPVLAKDKGRPRSMLHLEVYDAGIRASCGVWPLGAARPTGLKDPTPFLIAAAGLSHINTAKG